MPTISDLRQRQALPLGAKVLMTQNRIREWYNHFNGDVYVSFSGGKDSTVLAYLVRDMYPNVPGVNVPGVYFADLGHTLIKAKHAFSGWQEHTPNNMNTA